MRVKLPDDVRDYLTGLFRQCNYTVSEHMDLNPTNPEPVFDALLLSQIKRFDMPVITPTGWVVQVTANFVGSGEHYGKTTEISDILLVVRYYNNGEFFKSKFCLLQSKKLKAREQVSDDRDGLTPSVDEHLNSKGDFYEVLRSRKYTLDSQSKYSSLVYKDEQNKDIEELYSSRNIPIYYSLYNPTKAPHSINTPLKVDEVYTKALNISLGCRILPAEIVNSILSKKGIGQSPTLGDLQNYRTGDFAQPAHNAGWKLEFFLVDLFVGCEVGKESSTDDIQEITQMARRRGTANMANILVSINLPQGAHNEFVIS